MLSKSVVPRIYSIFNSLDLETFLGLGARIKSRLLKSKNFVTDTLNLKCFKSTEVDCCFRLDMSNQCVYRKCPIKSGWNKLSCWQLPSKGYNRINFPVKYFIKVKDTLELYEVHIFCYLCIWYLNLVLTKLTICALLRCRTVKTYLTLWVNMSCNDVTRHFPWSIVKWGWRLKLWRGKSYFTGCSLTLKGHFVRFKIV